MPPIETKFTSGENPLIDVYVSKLGDLAFPTASPITANPLPVEAVQGTWSPSSVVLTPLTMSISAKRVKSSLLFAFLI